MASQSPVQGDGRDVLALMARIEASSFEILESARYSDSWDALAADVAASYFTGDILRWFEGLDVTTQESWGALRGGLLANFITDDAWSDDGSDESRYISSMFPKHRGFPRVTLPISGPRSSCLVAWPAAPPHTVPAIYLVRPPLWMPFNG